MRPSRREFLNWVSAGGIALSLSRLGSAEAAGLPPRASLPGRAELESGRQWRGPDRRRRQGHRREALCIGFPRRRPPGWPANTSHAMLVRAPDATHVYARHGSRAAWRRAQAVGGGDRCRSRQDRHPRSRILRRRSVLPGRQDAALSGPAGRAADLRDVRCLRSGAAGVARWNLREVRRGDRPRRDAETTAPIASRAWPAQRRTRRTSIRRSRPAGSARDARRTRRFRSGRPPPRIPRRPMPRPRPWRADPRPNWRPKIPNLLVLDREFETQSVDPMFLEPESRARLVRQEAAAASNSCSACSRPTRRRNRSRILLGKARAPFKPARINAQFTYVGGGFGGRDHTPFVLYVALAAMFFPGRPVRLAHDRYQQFQAGIKRHAFKMRSRIGVDRATGKIQAFAADHVLDGGGLANFSANVATVGATAAIGIYDVPKVDVTTVALHSRGVTAGSMRGYGTLQTMTALEVLVDEVAAALPLDPIEFRRRNALKPGGRTMTGNPYSVSVRTTEILDKLEKHPIWQQRAQQKSRAPARHARRHRRRLRDQGLRHRRRLFARARRTRRRTAGSRSIAIMSRWATASAPRSPTAWRCISAPSPTRFRSRGSTPMTRSGWSRRAIPTRWTRRRRTPRRRIRAGCRRSARRPAPRSARMSARMRPPRPRASSSASACGRRRSSYGASRRTIRAPRIGRRRSGRTGSSSCRVLRRCRCRRSPRKRTRATS